MRATIVFLLALVLACQARRSSVAPSPPGQGSITSDRTVVPVPAPMPPPARLPPSAPMPAFKPPPPPATKAANAKPLTAAEIRAMTKAQASKQYETCSSDAHRVIRKMLDCGMDVRGVSAQWMCQKLNPSNIALLAETQGCQELHGLLSL